MLGYDILVVFAPGGGCQIYWHFSHAIAIVSLFEGE